MAEGLAGRLKAHYRELEVELKAPDPAGYDLVVNCTPLGMKPDDPLPFDVSRLTPATFVGEVVSKAEMTPLLQAAQARGCRFQVGIDMLFEMIPAYLEFFGFGTATADELRSAGEDPILTTRAATIPKRYCPYTKMVFSNRALLMVSIEHLPMPGPLVSDSTIQRSCCISRWRQPGN